MSPRPLLIFDSILCIAALLALACIADAVWSARRKPAGAPAPDAGVPLGAVWRSENDAVTALPGRGEVLFFDRHGRHRATLLDGTWPVRLVVYPVRGGEVRVEVDELGRASATSEAP